MRSLVFRGSELIDKQEKVYCVADDEADDEFEEMEQVLFQGPMYGREANLKKNPRLVQVALVPVKHLISDALSRRAHTIVLEPGKGRVLVKLYVDGIPYPGGAIQGKRGIAMIQMVKLLAGLDPQSRTEPQEGGIFAEFADHRYRLLVKSTPLKGAAERMRIRVEDVKQSFIRPADVGFPDHLKERIRSLTNDAAGIVLACGPRESGVTSLSIVALHCMDPYLYSVFNLADVGDRELVNVANFAREPGHDLETSLVRLIRQEADAIYMGRLDDPGVAQVVFDFSDRLCFFGEIDAPNPLEAVRKLIDWVGVDAVLKGLKGVITQKLIRRLCDPCKQAYRPSPQLLRRLRLPPETTVLYRPPAPPDEDDPDALSIEEMCKDCDGSPYHGRLAAYELFEMTDHMKEVVVAGANPAAMRKQMVTDGQCMLQKDALRLVVSGKTSLEELQRVFSSAGKKQRPRRRRPPGQK